MHDITCEGSKCLGRAKPLELVPRVHVIVLLDNATSNLHMLFHKSVRGIVDALSSGDDGTRLFTSVGS